MNNIYNNNQNSQNQDNSNINNSHNQHTNSNVSNNKVDAVAENTVKKSLMKKISIGIVLLVVIYGSYLSFNDKFANTDNNLDSTINTEAESYILLDELASKLNFKNSNIEKYSFDWNAEKYEGYSFSSVSFTGVSESPFNDELKNIGFVESENNLAEGRSVGLSVYTKDDLICIIKNDATNPDSWGTNNPDYSSSQILGCLEKVSSVE